MVGGIDLYIVGFIDFSCVEYFWLVNENYDIMKHLNKSVIFHTLPQVPSSRDMLLLNLMPCKLMHL